MTGRDPASESLVRAATEAFVRAATLAQRYPHNAYYRAFAKDAADDLERTRGLR